jgi:hypothetical protein
MRLGGAAVGESVRAAGDSSEGAVESSDGVLLEAGVWEVECERREMRAMQLHNTPTHSR